MGFNNFYQRRIYLDLDGTICDLLTQWNIMTRCGMSPKDFEAMTSTEELYDEFKKYGEKFWSTMQWKKDGRLLYNYLKKYRPIILTKSIGTKECEEGKEQWVRNNLQARTEILFADKKEVWADSDSILIDDNQINCNKFVIAGGNAIIHISAIETIKILKEKYGM